MKTPDDIIDQSVYTSAAPKKGYIPMFPTSTAEKMKAALVKKLTGENAGVAARLVVQAVNEAYALAAWAGEPLLFLPALAEEKVRDVAAWSARQAALLRGGSREMTA